MAQASKRVNVGRLSIDVLVLSGASLVLVGLLTPWDKGSPVPYAPGDDTASARAAELTAQGYTSGSVTVFEGRVSAIQPDLVNGLADPDYTVTLSSGAPGIYVVEEMDSPPPPVLTIGEFVRAWSVPFVDVSGDTRMFAARLEAGGSRWMTGYFATPILFEGGSAPAVLALALGGVPGGLAAVIASLALSYRRSVLTSPTRRRAVDHFALGCAALSILACAAWFESVRYTGSLTVLTLLLPVLPIVALIAGIASVATRKPGDRLWPSLVGITLWAVLLVTFAGIAALNMCTRYLPC
jgi:hypothetical protein